jgi:hypothetical protein
VERLVKQGVADPSDLPGRADRIAEIGGDAAAEVQRERPADDDRQQQADGTRADQLATTEHS